MTAAAAAPWQPPAWADEALPAVLLLLAFGCFCLLALWWADRLTITPPKQRPAQPDHVRLLPTRRPIDAQAEGWLDDLTPKEPTRA